MPSRSAEHLIYDLHGQLLRTLAFEMKAHYQGIAQAARMCKRQGRISAAVANKLVKLDFAYHLIRHVTEVSTEVFLQGVLTELRSSGSPSGTEGKESHDAGPSVEMSESEFSGEPEFSGSRELVNEYTSSDDVEMNKLILCFIQGARSLSTKIDSSPDRAVEKNDLVGFEFSELISLLIS